MIPLLIRINYREGYVGPEVFGCFKWMNKSVPHGVSDCRPA